ELVEDDERSSLAVVHEFIGNQGEAWTVTSAYLERFVEEQRLVGTDDAGESNELGAYQLLIAQIGLRLAQMQVALASRDNVADFRPDPITEKDVAKWVAGIVARGTRVRDRVVAQRTSLAEPDRAMAEDFIAATRDLEGMLRGLVPKGLAAHKIRTH